MHVNKNLKIIVLLITLFYACKQSDPNPTVYKTVDQSEQENGNLLELEDGFQTVKAKLKVTDKTGKTIIDHLKAKVWYLEQADWNYDSLQTNDDYYNNEDYAFEVFDLKCIKSDCFTNFDENGFFTKNIRKGQTALIEIEDKSGKISVFKIDQTTEVQEYTSVQINQTNENKRLSAASATTKIAFEWRDPAYRAGTAIGESVWGTDTNIKVWYFPVGLSDSEIMTIRDQKINISIKPLKHNATKSFKEAQFSKGLAISSPQIYKEVYIMLKYNYKALARIEATKGVKGSNVFWKIITVNPKESLNKGTISVEGSRTNILGL